MPTSVEHTSGTRLKEFLQNQQINETDAANRLGMRLPQLKRILEGKVFRMHWVLRMQSAFPSLNPRWLISGVGQMVIEEQIVATERERKEVALLDEARNLRNRVHNLPAKRKAELCKQVIEVSERLYFDNQQRRKRLLKIRRQIGELKNTVVSRNDLFGVDEDFASWF